MDLSSDFHCLRFQFGILIWEDDIRNWRGYITVYAQLLVAIYLVIPYNTQIEESVLMNEAGFRHTMAKSVMIRRDTKATHLLADRDMRISKIDYKSSDVFAPRTSMTFKTQKVRF